MKEKKFQTFIDGSKYLEELEGTKILRQLKNLNHSLYIEKRNYDHLKNIIDFHQNNIEIMGIQNRDKLNSVLLEFIRLFHNYLASISSLKLHTSVIRKNINKTHQLKSIENDIEKKIEEYDVTELFAFLRDFRNYILHKGIPNIASIYESETIDKDWKPETLDDLIQGPKQKSRRFIGISKDELLMYSKWSKDAKSFIRNQLGDIDLIDILDRYQNFINYFYKWIFDIVHLTYNEAIQYSLQTQQEVKDLFQRGK